MARPWYKSTMVRMCKLQRAGTGHPPETSVTLIRAQRPSMGRTVMCSVVALAVPCVYPCSSASTSKYGAGSGLMNQVKSYYARTEGKASEAAANP